MIARLFLLITLSLTSFSLWAQGKELHNHIVEFSGNNSKYGNYQGELEIRDVNGELSAIRIITYDSFFFEGLNVQEVWTGRVLYHAETKTYTMTYQLKKADFLSYAEGVSRSVLDFQTPLILTQTIKLSDHAVNLESFTRDDEVFSEKFSSLINSGDQPLWENKRYRVESVAHESSSLFRLAGDLVRWKVFNWYHDQPFPQLYKEREEFKLKKQYFIYDPTDYDFYQHNKETIRLVNKRPDSISFIEDMQRRNAYAFTLQEKMQHFEADMRFHINEYGMFSGSQFNEEGQFQKYLVDGDGAIWTGMYAAAQAMRYQVTHETEALMNLKKSLNGLMLLMDITENNKEFARTIVKYDPELTDKNLHRGNKEHSDKAWLALGNNDMFKGLIHSFIWAYLVLPESEKELRSRLAEHMVRLADLRIADEIQNKAAAYGLRAIVTGSKEDHLVFRKSFIKEYTLTKMVNIEGQMHIGGVLDWSGANLAMVSGITDILIARALGDKKIEKRAQKDLLYSWKDLASTKRDFLTIAAYTFAISSGFDINKVNEWGDDYTNHELKTAWQKDYKSALWSLREIQINRSKYDTAYDYSLQPGWCLSWWPRSAWDSFKEKKPADYHYQGVDSHPLFEGQGLGNSFIWKSHAFNFRGGSNKKIKEGGTDYLYSYWMARLSGMINETN